MVAGICLIHGSGLAQTQATDADSAENPFLLGEQIYGQSCAVCHYDGSGNPAAPDLIGSPYWKEGAHRIIRLILHGQSRVSVVEGKLFNGEMPAMDNLTDEEIAAVTTYVLSRFAEQKDPVDPATVARLRTESGSGETNTVR